MGQPSNDELLGQLIRRDAEREAERARCDAWRETVDDRLDRLTTAVEKLNERMWEESSRRTEVDIDTLKLLAQKGRDSRRPSGVSVATKWKVLGAIATALATLAALWRQLWSGD